MPDQKNLILAIAVSIAILVGFQFLFPHEPRVVDNDAQRQAELAVTGETAVGGAVPGDPTASPGRAPLEDGTASAAPVGRDEALAEAPRLPIDTPSLHGSINLRGGRIDDLTLVRYRETVDPRSPEIELLSPLRAARPYYADFGWTAAAGQAVPDASTEWTADAASLAPGAPVTLRWDNGAGLVFEQVVSVDADYMFTVEQRVTNTGTEPASLTPYGRILRLGKPETSGYFILHEGPYGVLDGALKEYKYGDIEDEGTIAFDSTGGWLGFTDKYWMAALVPDQAMAVQAQFVHTPATDATDPAGVARDRYLTVFSAANALEVAPGATATATSRLFAGAKEVRLIDAYEDRLGIQKFDRAIDWGWFYFLTKPMFYALDYIYGLVGNFGLAILGLTVLVKLLFFPLANKSYSSMSKMKALQPEIVKLRERFKDDRQKMNAEMMELYRRQKVNPASGCLPIVVQIPVFFALYKVLFITIEMRHAPFFGWIHDLSAPDPTSLFNLFGLIPWDPPQSLMIGIWPIIMGVTMFLQQKLNPAPVDPMQQRIFMALPVVFTYMLAHFPAGLVIYWAWNNTLSILQQWVIMRRHGVRVGGGTDKPDPAARRRGEAAPSAEALAGAAEAPDAADLAKERSQDAKHERKAPIQSPAGRRATGGRRRR